MSGYRVLVTGSRDWEDGNLIFGVLDDIGFEVGLDWMVVIHGACPTGADHYADLWAEARDTGLSRHPADWDRHGKAAGPRRNAEMVAAGANVCLAFIGPCRKRNCRQPQPHGSHGATGCADLAEKAGIETRRFTDGW